MDNYEVLPFHALKRLCKEKGIVTKNTDKKDVLVKFLKDGKSSHEKKVTKPMPNLSAKAPKKFVASLPEEIMPSLEELAVKGLRWKIDEVDGCVTFIRDLAVSANLDQSAQNILMSARQAFAGKMPGGFSLAPSNDIQANNLDSLKNGTR